MIYKIQPVLRSYIWGGDKLQKIFKVKQDNLAEAWILSALEDESSKIVGGNKTILDLFTENPSVVSKEYRGEFPILVKLLCSSRDLSVQNHPVGKAEFWHIIDAEKDAFIYLGLSHKMSKDELIDSIKKSTICDHLNKIRVRKGDCFYIPPGVIHSLGKGIFALEIQQNLNVTYRLFDFNRLDSNGKLRELKIDEGVKVADLSAYNVIDHNVEIGSLIKCPFFSANRYEGKHIDLIDSSSFAFLYVLEGHGFMTSANEKLSLKVGDCYFIPSGEGQIGVDGKLKYIIIKK